MNSKFKIQNIVKSLNFGLSFWILVFGFWFSAYAQEKKEEPIIVNGDKVEYSTDSKEFVASGNVEVDYKGTKLTCQKLTLNSVTKDGQAEGNARLEDKRGVIEGEKLTYNFNTKSGTIIDSGFMSNPYFGKAETVKKISDAEFIALRGSMSTCNYDNAHYRIKSRKMTVFPGDKVQTKDNTFYIGQLPVFYLPQYNHSMRDKLMHIEFMPGSKKDWGYFLLTGWRYNINENIKGRILLDYREKLGLAEGFGLNYKSRDFGQGDFKYYYTHENDKSKDIGSEPDIPREFQRYFVRWRHTWKIDERTDLTSEYYKIVDSKRALYGPDFNILKDFFPLEYEKDSQPLSYVLVHHLFSYSSLDFLMQKRINRWYTQLEKLPEIKYTLPNIRIGETPFYFENNTQLANFNYKHAVPSPSTDDISMVRLDTSNKFSLPMKVAFLRLSPFVMSRETFYNKDVYDSSFLARTIFYSGAEVSAKFYRIFDVKSNFLGMDINGLRHIITPTISYTYNHEPTILRNKLRQIDDIDWIGRYNAVYMMLSNKLQTKRNGQKVDLVDFRVSSTYKFKPKYPDDAGRRGSSFSDFLFELDLIPYSWVRLYADATYNHYQDYFSDANANLNFYLGKERSISFGERYQRKGGKQFTFYADWRLNPKWKFGVYERYQFARTSDYKRGFREQQYTIARDLHCWLMEFVYNITKENGHSIWVVFRLKAFPEMEFSFSQTYYKPTPGSEGSQPNP